MKRIEDLPNYEELNIIVFIGNGFDISVLNKYRNDGLLSTYSQFYDYLCCKNFNTKNLFFEKMKIDKEQEKENWSDFESSIYELQIGDSADDLQKDLYEIQKYFLLFLNEIVGTDILINLNDDSERNKWSTRTLSSFLTDLSEEQYERIIFPSKAEHHKLFNYTLFNFNYTSIFDNYIFLDKYQHDPEKYPTSGNNFNFEINPNNYKSNHHKCNSETTCFCKIVTNILHPHGCQAIPRSLLFGIENSSEKKLNKSYWGKHSLKYKNYLKNVDLFIIYGSSLGKSDSWWWREIYESILEFGSELIIYYYIGEKSIEEDEIKELFIDACDLGNAIDKNVKNNIFVVIYDDNGKLNAFSLADN